jgi:hypothetical protein
MSARAISDRHDSHAVEFHLAVCEEDAVVAVAVAEGHDCGAGLWVGFVTGNEDGSPHLRRHARRETDDDEGDTAIGQEREG